MGPFVVAWGIGLGIMTFRAVKADKRPPWPGQLMVGSGYFILLGMLAQYRPARSVATLTAYGVDLAALFQVLPGLPKMPQDAGGPWPPQLAIPPTMLMPDGVSFAADPATVCTDGQTASAASGAGTSGPNASVPSSGSLAQMLTSIAQQFGWGAGEVSAWQKVLGAESGGNPKATNPKSGAFGAAQALGHGVSGTACPSTKENNYGPINGNWLGMSAAQMQAANCGSLPEQLLWMAHYMKLAYGSPSGAWAHEQANNWY